MKNLSIHLAINVKSTKLMRFLREEGRMPSLLEKFELFYS